MAGINDNLIPPVKGEIRNPKGRGKGTLNSKTILKKWLELEEVITNPVTGKSENMTQLDILYLKQLANGRKGDLKASQWILDRFEGKSAQSVDITTDGKALPTPILGTLLDDVRQDNGRPEAS